MSNLIMTIGVIAIYTAIAYIAGSYLNLLDGIRRLVLSFILGGFLIPIAACLFAFRMIVKLIKWLFRID